jgi:hypothetical protein
MNTILFNEINCYHVKKFLLRYIFKRHLDAKYEREMKRKDQSSNTVHGNFYFMTPPVQLPIYFLQRILYH